MPTAGRIQGQIRAARCVRVVILTPCPRLRLWVSGSQCKASWHVPAVMPPVAYHSVFYHEVAVHERGAELDLELWCTDNLYVFTKEK